MTEPLHHRALRRLRRGFDALLPPPEVVNYTGPQGCLRAGASFVTWNQIEGDYLEFGAAGGDSFVAAARAMLDGRAMHAGLGFESPDYELWKKAPPRFFAFDSFQGLPPGEGARHVDYALGAYSASEAVFSAKVARGGVPMDRVVKVPGFFHDTLTAATKQRLGLSAAAMVMVDCDLYESTVPVLDFITGLVSQGTIVVFHDWFRFRGRPDQGEQRACREWLARNPHLELIEFWREAPQAVSFLVNLR